MNCWHSICPFIPLENNVMGDKLSSQQIALNEELNQKQNHISIKIKIRIMIIKIITKSIYLGSLGSDVANWSYITQNSLQHDR